MRESLRSYLVLVALLTLVPGTGEAITFATGTADQAGNQAWTGTLGNDFTVGGLNILVTEVGAFDDDFDGLAGPITVSIWNISTMTKVAGDYILPASSSSGGDLNPFRFIDIADVVLQAGESYSIVAEGFDSTDENGNSNLGGWTALTFSAVGLTFDGGRFDSTAGVFPDEGSGAYHFGAGNFKYTVIPEPGTALLMAFGILGLCVRSRAS